ncbi:MAG: hypothetical protein R2734_15020 [Nocardioides sp.]
MADVIAHLQARFPAMSAEAIAEAVRSLYQQYDGAAVRTFLPILVEREAGDRLRALSVA